MATHPKVDCLDLALKMQALEKECFMRGFIMTARAINAATNKLGWETSYKLTGKMPELDECGHLRKS